MKKRLILSLVLSIVLVPAVYAATDAEMQACFQSHAQLMEKPALRNLFSCWRVHGFLM